MGVNFRGKAWRRTGASGLRLLLEQHANNVAANAIDRAIERTPLATGCHDSSRYTIRRLPRTICAGIWIMAFRNVAKSILSSVRFSATRLSFHRPISGNNNAAHAFRLQAKLARDQANIDWFFFERV